MRIAWIHSLVPFVYGQYKLLICMPLPMIPESFTYFLNEKGKSWVHNYMHSCMQCILRNKKILLMIIRVRVEGMASQVTKYFPEKGGYFMEIIFCANHRTWGRRRNYFETHLENYVRTCLIYFIRNNIIIIWGWLRSFRHKNDVYLSTVCGLAKL